MHDTPMTLDEFETQLDLYGAVLDRWPQTAAARAERLLETSAAARTLLEQSSAIASLLDAALPAVTLTTGAVRSRVLAEVERDIAQPSAFGWLLRGPRILRPLAIVAVLIPLGLGYAIGSGDPANGVNDDLVSDVSLLAFAEYEADSDAN
jgi:anti-sigma factor RsiW